MTGLVRLAAKLVALGWALRWRVAGLLGLLVLCGLRGRGAVQLEGSSVPATSA